MRLQIILILALTLFYGCKSESDMDSKNYPSQFGEIPFDPNLDDPNFKLCDSTALVHSRTSLSYLGGRSRIEDVAQELFDKNANQLEYNGFVVVRFLVNCDGKVGHLRFEFLDDGFRQQEYPEGLATIIKQAVLALDQWTITTPANDGKDHSKYMNFKIKNGKIDAIMH